LNLDFEGAQKTGSESIGYVIADILNARGSRRLDSNGFSQCIIRLDFDITKESGANSGELILLSSIAKEFLAPDHPWLSNGVLLIE
jgi:hypothetical protein